MTSITDRHEPHEGDDMGPTTVNDRTTITVPLVLTLGGVLLGAVLWANSMNVTLAVVQKDQTNDRDRLQRIEQALERVETKLDRIRYAAQTQPQQQATPDTDFGTARRFDR